MPPRKSRTKPRRTPAALAGLGVAVLAVGYFAVQGGEYGTTDLFRQRARVALLQHEVDSLSRQVDSLGRYKRAIETDPLVQERLAREEFGMVKGDKEILYRFAESPEPAAKR